MEEQLARISEDSNRPLLQTADLRGKLKALLAVRDPLYREVADLIITTDGCRARQVMRQILSCLKSREG